MDKNGRIHSVHVLLVSYLLAPHSDQSAISNRFSTTQHHYRQTDGRSGIGIAIGELYAAR